MVTIGTYQRPIQRYHCRPSTTYSLATIQNITDRQTTDRQQMDRTSYHKHDRTIQYGRLKMWDQLTENQKCTEHFPFDGFRFSTLTFSSNTEIHTHGKRRSNNDILCTIANIQLSVITVNISRYATKQQRNSQIVNNLQILTNQNSPATVTCSVWPRLQLP